LDDGSLHHHAAYADQDSSSHQVEPEVHASLQQPPHRIRAEHEELAVGHVDDLHHPENDEQTHRH
jgi:hypothetical protein